MKQGETIQLGNGMVAREILPETAKERVMRNYHIISDDYRDGLIYGVSKELVSQTEKDLSELLGKEITLNVENSEDYVQKVFLLLREV